MLAADYGHEAPSLKVATSTFPGVMIHVLKARALAIGNALTQKLLDTLRHYWCSCKIKPRVYLLPSHWETTEEEKPISGKSIWNACHESALRAGINKRLGPHTLRHCFATHMFGAGAPTCGRFNCCWGTAA